MTQFTPKPIALGLVFAILTLLFGQGIAMYVGIAEDSLKESMLATVAANPDNPDLLKKSAKDIEKKAFRYVLRGHFHGTGIGAMSMGLILALGLSWVSARWKMILSLGVGVGGFVYPLTWFGAGMLMPSMGKEAARGLFEILVFPAIGAMFLSILMILWIWWLSFRSADGVPEGWDALKR